MTDKYETTITPQVRHAAEEIMEHEPEAKNLARNAALIVLDVALEQGTDWAFQIAFGEDYKKTGLEGIPSKQLVKLLENAGYGDLAHDKKRLEIARNYAFRAVLEDRKQEEEK